MWVIDVGSISFRAQPITQQPNEPSPFNPNLLE